MANITELTLVLTKSINTPLMQADPAHIAIVADIENIITQQVKQMEYRTVEEVPYQEEGLLILLAKKEVYWRLATATAPNYDLETEFTKLVKSKRFDHYFKLIGAIQIDIDKTPSSIKVADVTMRSREGSIRNYILSKPINTGVSSSSITNSSVNLDWIAFDATKGAFLSYDVLISSLPLYDEYSHPVVDYRKAEQRITISDIKRVKYRVTNLEANTKYYVVIEYKSVSGNFYASLEFTTLA